MKKTGRSTPKKEQSVFIVTVHHRSKESGQIESEIVFVGREFLQALASARQVPDLGYRIREGDCGISVNMLKIGTLYRANHRITPSDELPPHMVAHVSWLNGFRIEFTREAAECLVSNPVILIRERAFWASKRVKLFRYIKGVGLQTPPGVVTLRM